MTNYCVLRVIVIVQTAIKKYDECSRTPCVASHMSQIITATLHDQFIVYLQWLFDVEVRKVVK